MTESQWLACREPAAMLRSLCARKWQKVPGGPGLDPERFRVFAAACARRLWEYLSPNLRHVLQFMEGYPDQADPKLLPQVQQIAMAELEVLHARYSNELALTITQWRGRDYRRLEEVTMRQQAATMIYYLTSLKPYQAAQAHTHAAQAVVLATHLIQTPGRLARSRLHPPKRLFQGEHKLQAALLRDVFGNPYHRPVIDPAWRTWGRGVVVRVAERAREERDPTSGELAPVHLGVLADALEEAGCSDAALLTHLRSPGSHVRGCWAVNLVLGKD